MDLVAAEASACAELLEAQREALRECLKRLPEPQRDLVERAYAPESRMDRLARVFGMTAMALYKKLHRIRMVLSDCARRRAAMNGGHS